MVKTSMFPKKTDLITLLHQDILNRIYNRFGKPFLRDFFINLIISYFYLILKKSIILKEKHSCKIYVNYLEIQM